MIESLVTGLDDDNKRPKNVTEQLVRILDDDDVTFPDRLRLIIEYILFRDGVFPSDLEKLLAHAKLPARDGEVIHNLEMLGANIRRQLKDSRPAHQPIFPHKPSPNTGDEELSLSRFEPAMRYMLEEQLNGTLDQTLFRCKLGPSRPSQRLPSISTKRETHLGTHPSLSNGASPAYSCFHGRWSHVLRVSIML
jgi:syntaxin-binding protein 1